ncbi:hypothetical protein CMI37_36700 [Candidatus Pacearchaeota archaeon]|nr:hypothetical protein [Candidatus Pacearchaeota archaeon]|tara:strand:+ start:5311 stop:5886 length:576 start_codon:yes stop_codon:yes gene_type:complete
MYEGKTVAKVEKEIDSHKLAGAIAQKDMVTGLYYLRNANRYMKNPKYKNATWERYLGDRYGMRPGTYDKMCFAFLNFPEAAVKLGSGIINKTKDRCGAIKMIPALDEIMDLPRTNRTPWTERVDSVIDKYARPEREERPETGTSPSKNELWTEINRLRAELSAKDKELEEAYAQIEKMKATIEKLKAKGKP